MALHHGRRAGAHCNLRLGSNALSLPPSRTTPRRAPTPARGCGPCAYQQGSRRSSHVVLQERGGAEMDPVPLVPLVPLSPTAGPLQGGSRERERDVRRGRERQAPGRESGIRTQDCRCRPPEPLLLNTWLSRQAVLRITVCSRIFLSEWLRSLPEITPELRLGRVPNPEIIGSPGMSSIGGAMSSATTYPVLHSTFVRSAPVLRTSVRSYK